MKIKTNLKITTLIFVFIVSAQAQTDIILTEIMFSPSVDGTRNEFVELYNPTNQTIDLKDYQIGVVTSSDFILSINDSTLLAPNSFAVVVEGDYDSNNTPYTIPGSALVVKIDDNSFGSSGMSNSSDRIVFVINGVGDTASTYTYSANNSAGYSDEKIILNNDNSSSNWANALALNGTPGYKNSVSPKEDDLAITEINISPSPAIEGETLTASLKVLNYGTQNAATFDLKLYNDTNKDSAGVAGELVNTFTLNNLAAGDSVVQNFNLGSLTEGNYQLIGIVELAGDEAAYNDTLFHNFDVLPPPPPFNAIVINEIMYAPPTGEPEWVEIYNRSGNTYNLADWKFADAGAAVTITNKSISISPGEYVIITDDTSIVNYFDFNATVIVTSNLPALNNTGDRAVLMDNNSFVVDSLTYGSSWGGSSGNSLERIDFDSPSHLQNNWGTSVSPDRATPGDLNSLAPKDFDLAVTSVAVTPSPLIENTNLTAQIDVKNIGKNNAASYTVRIYDDENFDSTPQAGELITFTNLTNLASGDSTTQNLNIGSFSAGSLQLIAQVVFASDENNSNNELIEEFTVHYPPPPTNSVVINEIMYAPPTGEPEWVEIYNRSDQTYNLANWQFADAGTAVTITVDPVTIEPDEFIVLAKSGTITDFFDIDATIVIVSSLPALNNTGDKAILMDGSSSVIDSLTFTSSWGGSSGNSLERIDVDSPSSDQENWGTSISPNRATPGTVNSLTPKDFDLAVTEINISPSPTIEGDKITVDLKVKNLGKSTANTYFVRLYNDLNFDSNPQSEELIESFTRGNLAAGDSVLEQYNLGMLSAGNVQLIGSVVFSSDEDDANNRLIYEFTVFPPPPPFNAVVINEIMYAPLTGEPEWVEIYNRSDQTYNLANWQFADAATTALITFEPVSIAPGEYIVLSKDSTLSDFFDIDAMVIEFNLPSLNNGGDQVILMDDNSFVIDSLTYQSTWGGSSGRSLERIDTDSPSHLQNNWGTSVSPNRATPGKENSIAPREFDLAVIQFNSTNTFLILDETSTFQMRALNLGTSNMPGANFKIYFDSDNNESFTEDEMIAEFTGIDFESNQEVERVFTYTFNSPGEVSLLAVINHPQDTYPQNDSLFLQKEVFEPQVIRGQIVINEFMYAPTAPYPEWIELYNNSNTAFQLRDFKIADLNDTVSISSQNILLQPESYLVVSRDSIITQLYNIPSQVIIKSFPSLNNSGDRIMLLDNYNRIIDSLDYTSEWGGTNGKSLERINPLGNSTEQSNWATSTDPDNGTPGKLNSTAPKDYDVAVTNFYCNPQQPVTGETVSLLADISNKGLNDADFNLHLYESNSAGEKLNLLETVNIENLSAGNSAIIEFDYKIESFTGESFFITETDYPEDQDLTNNSSLLFISSAAAPLSIIINEIMFNPQDDEPEWIEIYNNSGNSINLRDWQISDVITNPAYTTITTENYYIAPGKFVVLSKDSGIYGYHPNLSEGVILLNFAILNNTEDGVVIYNRFGETIDSVFYSSEFPKKTGHSIERISYDGSSTNPENWDYSISFERGTPGFINSRTPKNYDLALEDMSLIPKFPELNQQIQINVHITNMGLLQSAPAAVNIYSEMLSLDETIEVEALESEANITITLTNTLNMPESFEVTAEIIFTEDENSANNILSKTFYSGYAASSVLINEVMYAPTDDESEWVELINASNTDINIKEWKIAEGSTFDSPRIITEQDIIVKPGEYIIIADDTTGGNFTNLNAHIFQVNFGEMNSTEDIVVVFDFRGAIIDSLKYSSSWGGGNGYSIERISLETPTNERANWLASITIGGSTPGAANSTVSVKQLDEDQRVVINEIMFDPNTGDAEFIEFYNTSDQFLEVANWNVEDDSKNNSILTRSTFQIAPDSYFLVAADSTILLSYPGLKEFNQLMIVNGNLSLNNTGDLILLSDAFGNMVDSVHYSSGWHNQKVITTKGKSLERINPFLDGNDNNNWSTSVASEGATPGKANSIYIENQSTNKTISVTPNPFSPDGDGYEDFVIINYNLPRDVTSIQIKVFDSKGRKVRTINESNLFGKSGSIIFDGYNDDGQPLKIGIYILLIEALNSSSGTVDTFKEVVVVARKL